MLSRLQEYRNKKEEGFTLIELLVVILIIGILAAIAIPAFMNQRKAAVDKTVMSDVAFTAKALEVALLASDEQKVSDYSFAAVQAKNVESDVYPGAVASKGTSIDIKATSDGVNHGFCVFGTNPGGSDDGAASEKGIQYDSTKKIVGESSTDCAIVAGPGGGGGASDDGEEHYIPECNGKPYEIASTETTTARGHLQHVMYTAPKGGPYKGANFTATYVHNIPTDPDVDCWGHQGQFKFDDASLNDQVTGVIVLRSASNSNCEFTISTDNYQYDNGWAVRSTTKYEPQCKGVNDFEIHNFAHLTYSEPVLTAEQGHYNNPNLNQWTAENGEAPADAQWPSK